MAWHTKLKRVLCSKKDLLQHVANIALLGTFTSTPLQGMNIKQEPLLLQLEMQEQFTIHRYVYEKDLDVYSTILSPSTVANSVSHNGAQGNYGQCKK